MKNLIIFICLLLIFENSFSQKQIANSEEYEGYVAAPSGLNIVKGGPIIADKNEPCATKSIGAFLRENPGYQATYQRYVEEIVSSALNNDPSDCFPNELTRFIIPVVVHVVSCDSDSEPIGSSVGDIHNMLTRLNDDFNGVTLSENIDGAVLSIISSSFDKGSMINSIPEYSISFRLAEKDMLGNPTSGINFVNHGGNCPTSISEDNVCDLTEPFYWPPDKYLNIYIVKNVAFGVHGYSVNLFSIEELCADAVILPDHVVDDVENNEHLRHFPAHEVGHWLGLEHIWGAEPTCIDDDFKEVKDYVDDLICTDEQIDTLFNDTPRSEERYEGSGNCVADGFCSGYDYLNYPHDMRDNFMNYGSCRTTFSKGQIRLMETVLKSDIENRCYLHSLQNLESVFGGCVAPMPIDIDYEFNHYNIPTVPNLESVSINAPNYEGYLVRYYYKEVGESTFLLASPAIGVDGLTEVEFEDLDMCTTYIFKLEIECSDGSIHSTERAIFYGQGCSFAKKETSIDRMNKSITLYPNPTHGIFSLTIEDVEKAASFSLTDITGRKTNINSISKSQNTLEFDASDLDMGYYILTVIYANGEQAASKLVIN